MKRFFHKFITDKDGRVVIFQSPNMPIVGWFVSMVLSIIMPAGFLKTGFSNLGGAFLFLWSYLEITKGASYFRRFVGVIVLAVVVVNYFI